MTNLNQLHRLGQSTWLNYMRRAFIQSGELRSHIADGIQGITANASILEKTLAASTDYDSAVQEEVASGTPARRIHEELMIYDGQVAADFLHPTFESSDGLEGFVSLELDPALIHDRVSTIAAVRHLAARLNRVNVMVEVPATPAGLEAVQTLVGDGHCINITHIFSIDLYEKAAQAYIAGLEYLFTSHSMWRFTPTVVASFSLSPIDRLVDETLAALGHPELQGKSAISMAKVLHERIHEIFKGPRWEKLAQRGARVLRPKWTRTTPLNFSQPDTLYVDALIGSGTVTTFSPATLNAFLDHGTAASTLSQDLDSARDHLAQLAELGVDLDAITDQLQRDHLIASEKQFQSVIQTVMQKRESLEINRQRMVTHLHAYQETVDEALARLAHDRIMCRIWAHDHTVWKPEPKEISNRLGWLHTTAIMPDNIGHLQIFVRAVLADGMDHALLIGMGGSSLAPEVFQKTFGRPAKPPNMPHPYLDLDVLDTTDPDAIIALEQKLDVAKTLFIVATKSGSTVETLSGFKHFYNRLAEALGAENAGSHFVAITDPGSSLVDVATQYDFRKVFINDPNIGGRYSVLSYFGLVPAALVGVDLATLLARAAAMIINSEPCHDKMIHDNLAAKLGVILGRLAQHGRNKVTFILSSALASFGDWVEQLIAESTGKEGKGIVPVVGETIAAPDGYGSDRLFVHLRLGGDTMYDSAVKRLIEAGQPVIVLHLEDLYDLGGQFALWQMATAVAGHIMGINPFDQPNVEAAKALARQMMAAYQADGELPAGEYAPLTAEALHDFLGQAQAGDYISLQAYLQPTPAADEALQALRDSLQRQYKLATTVGYGPRFLHSTGQLHKGDGGNGLFIQVVSDPVSDIPIPDEAGKPGASISFGVLKAAQALGDARALRDVRRRLIRFHLGADVAGGLRKLT